jgi:hypothetical protein
VFHEDGSCEVSQMPEPVDFTFSHLVRLQDGTACTWRLDRPVSGWDHVWNGISRYVHVIYEEQGTTCRYVNGHVCQEELELTVLAGEQHFYVLGAMYGDPDEYNFLRFYKQT